MLIRPSAFYLAVEGDGRRFCVATRPRGEPIGALLYVHPVGEEMNKSRRMAALAARAFAERGWLVLQIDLAGCGDSSGDFGDASWPAWLADVSAAWSWLKGQVAGSVWLWSLRAGSLVVSDWLRTSGLSPPLLFWQPVGNGRQHLTQFLRLKGVSQMLEESDAKAAMSAARSALQAGEEVEVAGYLLSPTLANGLEAAQLQLPDAYPARVAVLEVVHPERCELSPGVRLLQERWAANGIETAAKACPGTAFWQTQEIEVCPALIDASIAVLEDLGR